MNRMFVYLIILLSALHVKAMDTISTKYFPLKVGNIWVYKYSGSGTQTTYEKAIVLKDTVMNSHVYYYCCKHPALYYDSGWVRVDSTFGSLRQKTQTNCPSGYIQESLVDSLSAQLNHINNCNHFACIYIAPMTIFNIQTTGKGYRWGVHQGSTTYEYYKDFGFVKSYSQYSLSWGETRLMGCVIDGIVYGDTSIPVISVTGNKQRSPFGLHAFTRLSKPFQSGNRHRIFRS